MNNIIPANCANCRTPFTAAEIDSVKNGPAIVLEAIAHWGGMHCNHCQGIAASHPDYGTDDYPDF